jgi:hypothetical protein
MPYVPTQAPPSMTDFDELRRWTEEEFRRLARATAEYDQKFTTLKKFLDTGAYREGSYTPVLSTIGGGGTVPTFTALAPSGKYIRMGRICNVTMQAQNTAGGTPGAGAQQLQMTLPFPVYASSLGARGEVGVFVNSTTESLATGHITAGSNQLALYKLSSTSNQVALTPSDFNNVTRSFSWQFFYSTD